MVKEITEWGAHARGKEDGTSDSVEGDFELHHVVLSSKTRVYKLDITCVVYMFTNMYVHTATGTP